MTELVTITLARLYTKQGFYDQALEVYLRLLQENPDNQQCLSEMEEIKKRYPGYDPNADLRIRLVAVNREIRLLESLLRRLGTGREPHGI